MVVIAVARGVVVCDAACDVAVVVADAKLPAVGG